MKLPPSSSQFPHRFEYLKGDCPICSGSRKDCRQSGERIHCRSDELPPSGFRFIGHDAVGFGMYVPDDGPEQHPPTHWEAQRQRREAERQQRQQQEQNRRAQLLPVEERDTEIRTLLDQLSLTEHHQQLLSDRGLTDAQITAGLFRSLEARQPIIGISPKLAGIDRSGQKLLISKPGILCPIFDPQGRITGWQTRFDNTDDNKYRWPSSCNSQQPDGPTAHLPNGELPITYCRPTTDTPQPAIGLAEGFLKSFIAAQKLDQIVLGAAGGNFAASPQLFQDYLEVAAQEQGCRDIIFYPDAAAVQNPSVMRSYEATLDLLLQWDFNVTVAWWGQFTQASPDVDELTGTETLTYLSVADFLAIAAAQQPQRSEAQRLELNFQKLLRRRRPKTKPAKGFGVQPQPPQVQPTEAMEYQPGERLPTWQRAIADGYRYILDQSATGTGKSFDSGNLSPESLGGRQIIYLSDQHRNPTVETLTSDHGWLDLEARHRGLSQVPTPGGTERLQRTPSDKLPDIPANCSRNGVIGTLRDKNVEGADAARLICNTCSLREVCTHATGPGYGYLHQRRTALASPRLRAHPDSLPSSTDYDFTQTTLVWDEPGVNLTMEHQIVVTLADLMQILTILMPLPDLFQQVQPLLSALIPLLNGSKKTGKFGLDHLQLQDLLPETSHLDPTAIAQATTPNLDFLNVTSEYGVDLADLPRDLRKQFSERDTKMAAHAKDQVLKQWLPELIQILQGQVRGALHLHHQNLTLTLPDLRHRTLAQAAKANIFLDATLSPEDLALKLGIAPTEIFVCRQAVVDPGNLTLIQISDLGRMGLQRGNEQERRLQALVEHYQALDPTTKVIDFKCHATKGMGVWWRDSRGVNDFVDTKTLLLVGAPCRNLNALRAEYTLLVGHYPQPEDLAFQAYVNRMIQVELHQAIGRLRAHRRPDESLQIIFISDFELDLPAQQVKASDITLEAADRVERVTLAIAQAIQQLKDQGQKVTQKAAAELSGIARGTIARYWGLFTSLLEDSNSKVNHFTDPPSDQVEVHQAIAEVLEKIVLEPPERLLPSLENIFFDWVDSDQWGSIWRLLPVQVQISLLAVLALTLPAAQLDRWHRAMAGP